MKIDQSVGRRSWLAEEVAEKLCESSMELPGLLLELFADATAVRVCIQTLGEAELLPLPISPPPLFEEKDAEDGMEGWCMDSKPE